MTIAPAELEVALRAVIAQPGHPRYPEVAEALTAANRFTEAIQVAEQGLAVLPKPEGQIALANANLQMGRIEHAQAAIERVLAASPQNTAAMRVLGECHLRAGRPDLAGPVLQRAAGGMPPDARARELWASLGSAPPPPSTASATPSPEMDTLSLDLGGELELDSGSAPGAGAPPAVGMMDAGLELELDGPTEVPAPAFDGGSAELELDLGGSVTTPPMDPTPQRGFDPSPAPTARPPSDPGMAADRRKRSTTGSRLQPYAPPHLAKERRQKVLGVLLVLVLIGAGGGGFYFWQRSQEAAIESALAGAAASAAADTAVSLATAEASVQEALALAPEHPEALGLGAFVAARRFTAFEAPTDTLITAQERIARAEVLPEVSPLTRVAQGMILVEQKRYGEVVEVISAALAEDPGNPGLLWSRAQAERGLERLPLAVETLVRAHERDPNYLPLIPTLAEALHASDRSEEAVDLLARTVDAHPEHLKSVILLLEHGATQKHRWGDLLERAGKLEQGLRTSATPTELCEFNLAAAGLALAAGDADRTRRFENGASSAEADASCREKLGQALLSRERPCAAVDVLAGVAEAIAGEAPERAQQARMQAAKAALRCGRTTRATGLVGRLPEGAEKTLLEVRIEAADGRLVEARKKLEPLLKKRETASQAWAVAATLATMEGDLSAARKAALRASQRAGRDREHRLEVARLLLSTGEARQAASLVGAPKRREQPSHAQLALRGEALLLAASRTGPGLAELERAIAMNPDADRAVNAYLSRVPASRLEKFAGKLGAAQAAGLHLEVLLRSGDLKGAATLLEANPPSKNEPLRLSLGRALSAIAGGSAGKITTLNELSLGNKHVAQAQTAHALGLHHLGKLGDALLAYDAAIALEPAAVEPRVGRAEALVDGATNPDEALEGATRMLAWVEELAATDRQLGRAHAALAIARAELTDKAGAKTALGRALQLAGSAPRVRYAEARVIEAQGDTRQAIHLYQLAARQPGGELALLRLGVMGVDEVAPPEVARAALERFLELQPGHAQASRAKQLLSALP